MNIYCKKCNSILKSKDNSLICDKCFNVYQIVNDIIQMETSENYDLRMTDKIPNYHLLRNKRLFFDNYVHSNVNYAAYQHSNDFNKFHIDMLHPYLNNSSILDLGCGQIPFINFFDSTKIKSYYALDLHSDSLEIVRESFKNNFPLFLVQHGVYNTPFSDEVFDIVISSEILEHLDNPSDYLKETYRVCKKGGYLSLSTPCVSIYFYPYSLALLVKHPTLFPKWLKQINSHKYWKEALSWHPGLRPKILQKWIERAGFVNIRHETRLWYYATPIKPEWRIFSFLEKIGLKTSGKIFKKYLDSLDYLLSLNIPFIKWFGIRQFILCRKPE